MPSYLRVADPNMSILRDHIASPISRIHTRNPFQRHASYEAPFASGAYSPSQDRNLSPAAIALPSPTPSELDSI